MIPAKSNADLDHAYELLQSGKIKEAISIAEKFLLSEDLGIRITAKTLAALAHFHDGNYAGAASLYKRLAVITNEDQDWFNLCTSAVLAGQDELGDNAIEKATSKDGVQKTSPLSSIMMRYYYAQALADKGRFAKAKIELKVLLTIHGAISNTDEGYLTSTGYPPLMNSLDVCRKIYVGLNKDPEILRWLITLKNEVDEGGVKEIDGFIEQLKSN